MKSIRPRAAAAGVAALMCFAVALAGGAPKVSETAAAARQSNVDAAAVYAKQCAKCHGKDGRAKTLKAKFNKARDLTDAQWQRRVTDERIFNSIMQGGDGMPSFKKKLSEAQVESLVTFVRRLKK
jgi:mono/diheme cytochrome c family protein